MREQLKRIPFARAAWTRLQARRFSGSASYWERRYAQQGTSGAGSYGEIADFKASVLNRLVADGGIETVLELGCGDGNQLSLAHYPSYVGVDVSDTALALCSRRFAGDSTKRFVSSVPGPADLAMSLDVILHLVEDEVFEAYMRSLFGTATRMVVVFAEDVGDRRIAAHVRYRNWRPWVERNEPGWRLREVIENPHKGADSQADFFVYVPA